LLAWGSDECVLWETVLPNIGNGIPDGPRGMTFEPGDIDLQTCTYPNSKVWVGWHSNVANQVFMARLNVETGQIEDTVTVNNWTMGWANYPPYGAALDPDQNVWFTALRGEVLRIDTSNNLALDRWAPPGNYQFYGMAVDNEGHPWFGGCSGPVSTFDPDANNGQGAFTAIPNTSACHRGVAADTNREIWVASNSPCGLVHIDGNNNTVIKKLAAADFNNQCSTPVGVSIDVEGFVWMVDQAGWAWKIDPDDYSMEQVLIAGNHYTYSDMTGGGLNAVIVPQ
jgi:streptogramin lyase